MQPILKLFVFLILFTSCNSHRKKKRDRDEILNLIEKEIILPNNKELDDTTHVLDIIYKNDYSFVSHLDGSCGHCLESLMKWDSLMIDSPFFENKTNVIFYIHAFDYSIVKSFIESSNIKQRHSNIYFIVDNKNEFKDINNIPDDYFDYTFFINKTKKILFVANPTLHRNAIDIIRNYIKNEN